MSSQQAQPPLREHQSADADGPSLHCAHGLGVLTLLLLCGVQFLDVVDSSITNVAFPSIQRALHFSQQNLQWVASGYLLTYGDSCCSAVGSPTCWDAGGCWSRDWPCSRCARSRPGSRRPKAC